MIFATTHYYSPTRNVHEVKFSNIDCGWLEDIGDLNIAGRGETYEDALMDFKLQFDEMFKALAAFRSKLFSDSPPKAIDVNFCGDPIDTEGL